MIDQYSALRTLIDSGEKREEECRRFLPHVPHLLFRDPVVEFVYVETEYTTHAGRSDYVISARVQDETGNIYVRAYVWELKAPQTYIFEEDTATRLRPTEDLMRAENQLLHYCEEMKGSEAFRAEFGVLLPDHVSPGGIIIGSLRTRVRGGYSEEAKVRLFGQSKRIRAKYFYDPYGIRLLVWDRVLEQFQLPRTGVHSVPVGETITVRPAPVTVVTSGP